MSLIITYMHEFDFIKGSNFHISLSNVKEFEIYLIFEMTLQWVECKSEERLHLPFEFRIISYWVYIAFGYLPSSWNESQVNCAKGF